MLFLVLPLLGLRRERELDALIHCVEVLVADLHEVVEEMLRRVGAKPAPNHVCPVFLLCGRGVGEVLSITCVTFVSTFVWSGVSVGRSHVERKVVWIVVVEE